MSQVYYCPNLKSSQCNLCVTSPKILFLAPFLCNGFAAGCEAMALTRRSDALNVLGYAPGSGFALFALEEFFGPVSVTSDYLKHYPLGRSPDIKSDRNGEAEPSPHIRRQSRAYVWLRYNRPDEHLLCLWRGGYYNSSSLNN
jgi:hypothetical protein